MDTTKNSALGVASFGREASLLDPFTDLTLREPNVGLDPDIRNQATLNIAVNCFDINLQKIFKFLCCPQPVFRKNRGGLDEFTTLARDPICH